jgi:hypothetical protein
LFALGLHGSRDVEFRPDRANRFYALSADEIYTARTCDPTNPDYFSDVESERTASVAEEYKEAERAEKGTAADNEDISAQQLDPQKQNRPPSREKHHKLASKQRYHLREPWARWPAVGVGDQEAVA